MKKVRSYSEVKNTITDKKKLRDILFYCENTAWEQEAEREIRKQSFILTEDLKRILQPIIDKIKEKK